MRGLSDTYRAAPGLESRERPDRAQMEKGPGTMAGAGAR